jgi:hypothetical protein
MSPRAKTAKPKAALESDLYPVAARYFEERGFTVKGEVCGCDLVAVKGEEIIIAEAQNHV